MNKIILAPLLALAVAGCYTETSNEAPEFHCASGPEKELFVKTVTDHMVDEYNVIREHFDNTNMFRYEGRPLTAGGCSFSYIQTDVWLRGERRWEPGKFAANGDVIDGEVVNLRVYRWDGEHLDNYLSGRQNSD